MKSLTGFIIAFLLATNVSAQRYKKIHRKAIVCDTHNDIISVTVEKGYKFDSDLTGKTHSDLNRLLKGGLDVQVFSIYCDGTQKDPYNFANREIDSLYEWIKRNPSKMMLVKTPHQLEKAVKDHKLGCMIGVEGGHMIEDSLDKLDSLYNRGARYMTLTWNNNPSWATSAQSETDTSQHLVHKGLTDFGKEVVRKMNALGMMVDVSHVGDQTFWDVIATTTKPVIASHSDAYALNPAFRNLKDDQIKAIAKNGGVIQLNFFPGFLDSAFGRKEREFWQKHKLEKDSLIALGNTEPFVRDFISNKYPDEIEQIRAPLQLLFDHMEYIIRMAGIDHVGLGGDMDGIPITPKQLNDVTNYPLITKRLVEQGYSKKDINKILGGNFIRVFRANAAN